MKRFFYYKIFNDIIKSNVILPYFNKMEDGVTSVDLTILFETKNPKSIKDSFKAENINIYYDDICYVINVQKKLLEIYSLSKEIFNNVFLNVPLGVWFAATGRCLIHGSSVVKNNSVYCFCGDKGAGKSTLLNALLDKCDFFGDDQILLYNNENDIMAIPPPPIIKFTEQFVEEENILTENSIGKGLQDKYIFNANSITKKIYTNKCNLKKVFFLKRSREKDFFVERISNLQRKKMYVIINLIGSNKIIETNNDYILHHNDTINLIAEKVDMFNLYLPDKKYYKNIESFIEGDLI